MLNRRRFLGTLSASLLVAPLAAEAQPAERVYRIGLFHVGLDHVPPSLNGLRDGLKALGYEEGRNLKLDFRNVADEAAARAVALELVRQRPDLIVAFEDQTLRAAQAATRELPVVFLHVGTRCETGSSGASRTPAGT
jgi:putative ABC transport system substrate-binding protein